MSTPRPQPVDRTLCAFCQTAPVQDGLTGCCYPCARDIATDYAEALRLSDLESWAKHMQRLPELGGNLVKA